MEKLRLIVSNGRYSLGDGLKTWLNDESLSRFKEEFTHYHRQATSQRHLILGAGDLSWVPETDQVFIIYEPNHKIIEDLQQAFPERSACSKIKLVSNMDQLRPILHDTDENIVKSMGTFSFSSYAQRYPDLVQKLSVQADHANAQARLQKIALREITNKQFQAAKNLSLVLQRPYSHWMNLLFQNVPAVIVGAGPSLDYVIPILKKYQDSIFIFSTFTSTKSLVQAGISPHFVVSLEHRYLRYASNGVATEHIDLLASSWTHPNSLSENYRSQTMLAHDADPFFHLLFPNANFPTLCAGANVSCSALLLACYMGMNPIILAGQDLGYRSGKTYAQGSNYGSFKYQISKSSDGVTYIEFPDQPHITKTLDKLSSQDSRPGEQFTRRSVVPVPSSTNETVYATFQHTFARQWLEEFAKRPKAVSGKLQLFNASQGGGIIQGFEDIELGSFMESYENPLRSAGAMLHRARAMHQDEGLPSLEAQVNCIDTLQKYATYLRQRSIRALDDKFQELDRLFFPSLILCRGYLNDKEMDELEVAQNKLADILLQSIQKIRLEHLK
ncbi:MAG: 6-hydroxymethylpterin diphosphokinase MptE-like protein [Myxococcota bacterium]|nr:6-hydroxymethylpterin diphosphokinase MptE-like protein [Myxococcota bacterium]